MALTDQEGELLQQALCAGVFNDTTEINGKLIPKSLTPEVLKTTKALKDEEIRVKLRAYKSSRISQLTDQIAQMKTGLDYPQAQLSEIEALVIEPAP